MANKKDNIEVTEDQEQLVNIEELRIIDYRLDACSDLRIKYYLPFGVKSAIIKSIIETCIIEKSGIKEIDYLMKSFSLETSLVAQYTNLNCNVNNFVEFYDELKEKGVIDCIIEKIPNNERKFIEDTLDKELEQVISLENSIEGILVKGISVITDKIPNDKQLKSIIKLLPKEINKIDRENLKIIIEGLGLNNLAMDKSKK